MPERWNKKFLVNKCQKDYHKIDFKGNAAPFFSLNSNNKARNTILPVTGKINKCKIITKLICANEERHLIKGNTPLIGIYHGKNQTSNNNWRQQMKS